LYQKAIALDPDYYKPYLDYSVFLSGQGRFAGAIEQIQIVTRMAPGLRIGHYELGRNYLASGRLDEAEREFHTARGIHETWAELIGLGYVALLRGRYAESVSLHEKAMPIAPDLANLWANLGDAYRLAGRPADAASAYRKALAAAETAIQIKPTNAFEHAMVGYASARTGDIRGATVETNQALALAPGDSRVLWRAAVTWEAIRRRDQTLAVLRKAPVSMIEQLGREPDLSDLAADPRFIQLKTPQN
jgi:tetratricopeptide (TPR) repeat protein